MELKKATFNLICIAVITIYFVINFNCHPKTARHQTDYVKYNQDSILLQRYFESLGYSPNFVEFCNFIKKKNLKFNDLVHPWRNQYEDLDISFYHIAIKGFDYPESNEAYFLLRKGEKQIILPLLYSNLEQTKEYPIYHGISLPTELKNWNLSDKQKKYLLTLFFHMIQRGVGEYHFGEEGMHFFHYFLNQKDLRTIDDSNDLKEFVSLLIDTNILAIHLPSEADVRDAQSFLKGSDYKPYDSVTISRIYQRNIDSNYYSIKTRMHERKLVIRKKLLHSIENNYRKQGIWYIYSVPDLVIYKISNTMIPDSAGSKIRLYTPWRPWHNYYED